MSPKSVFFCSMASLALLLGIAVAQQLKPGDLGFTDTPMLPGQPWHVHDPARPHPKVIAPASTPGGAPSDAEVLFDGTDLSKWMHIGTGPNRGKELPAAWKLVEGGAMEVARGTSDLVTRESFGDCQLHVEWSSPVPVTGNSQDRGNSGVIIMGHYEIQVLDAWDNPTYADGQAAAIYGQFPPLVNPARKPGEWNTYDIIFEAPRFEDGKLLKPAYETVIFNGVVVHNHKDPIGAMVYRQVGKYTPHPAEEPLHLQYHNNPVRYRNIWIRRLGHYDEPEAGK